MRYRYVWGLVLLLIAASAGGAQQYKPMLVDHYHVDARGSAYTDAGRKDVALREIQADWPGLKSRYRPLDILIVFDKSGGTFLWSAAAFGDANAPGFRITEFREYEAVFLQDDRMLWFATVPARPSLFVIRRGGDAASIDSAEREVLAAVSRLYCPGEFVFPVEGALEIPLPELGTPFVTVPGTDPMSEVLPMLTATVTAVRREGRQWVVTMKGSWLESITLNFEFEVLSLKKIGA